MRQFVTYSNTIPEMRAWLNPEDNRDELHDPHEFREDGWRIVIERLDGDVAVDVVRSTWEQNIEAAIRHVLIRWPTEPIWIDFDTGEEVSI